MPRIPITLRKKGSIHLVTIRSSSQDHKVNKLNLCSLILKMSRAFKTNLIVITELALIWKDLKVKVLQLLSYQFRKKEKKDAST